jgi:DNA repair protein RadC
VLAACGRLRTLTAALRREGDVSGNPARCTEPIMGALPSFTLSAGSTSSPSSSNGVPRLLVREPGRKYRPARPEEVLQAAQTLLLQQVRACDVMGSPKAVRDFLRFRLGGLEHEVFAVLLLDAQNALIRYVELFRGTVTQTSVYPREVVKEALGGNAASVILVHNHPSGHAEPSRADEFLTQTLKAALALVDVRVLDHLVVTTQDVVSFAERGLV